MSLADRRKKRKEEAARKAAGEEKPKPTAGIAPKDEPPMPSVAGADDGKTVAMDPATSKRLAEESRPPGEGETVEISAEDSERLAAQSRPSEEGPQEVGSGVIPDTDVDSEVDIDHSDDSSGADATGDEEVEDEPQDIASSGVPDTDVDSEVDIDHSDDSSGADATGDEEVDELSVSDGELEDLEGGEDSGDDDGSGARMFSDRTIEEGLVVGGDEEQLDLDEVDDEASMLSNVDPFADSTSGHELGAPQPPAVPEGPVEDDDSATNDMGRDTSGPHDSVLEQAFAATGPQPAQTGVPAEGAAVEDGSPEDKFFDYSGPLIRRPADSHAPTMVDGVSAEEPEERTSVSGKRKRIKTQTADDVTQLPGGYSLKYLSTSGSGAKSLVLIGDEIRESFTLLVGQTKTFDKLPSEEGELSITVENTETGVFAITEGGKTKGERARETAQKTGGFLARIKTYWPEILVAVPFNIAAIKGMAARWLEADLGDLGSKLVIGASMLVANGLLLLSARRARKIRRDAD